MGSATTSTYAGARELPTNQAKKADDSSRALGCMCSGKIKGYPGLHPPNCLNSATSHQLCLHHLLSTITLEGFGTK